MSYVVSTDIPKYYQNLVLTDSDSIVTTADVTALISTEEAVFNAILSSLGYETVPLTDASDVLIAKQYVEWRIICTVDGILRESDVDTQFDFKRNMCKRADKMLDKILDGKMQFSEMRDSDSANMFNEFDDNGKEATPYFKRENIDNQLSIINQDEL